MRVTLPAPAEAETPQAKSYRRGTHRIVAPDATLGRVRPWLAEMGISRIANVTGLDRVGIPTVMVCRPNSRSVAVAQGKGADLAAAKASGIMEAVEAYHAENITLPLRYARRSDIGREVSLADIDGLPLQLGRDLPDDVPLLWVEGRDLVSGEARWLPLEVVSADYTLPPPPGSGYFQATTNGLASGNSFEEACLHAICELIERDASTLWHLEGEAARLRTRIDPATVDDPTALELLDRFSEADVQVGVWEVTTEIAVASFVALAAGSADDTDPEIGAGCHPAPGVALCRALTEAAQARLGVISGARDDLLPSLYTPPARRQRAESARAWLASDGRPRRFGDAPALAGETIAGDLARVIARLANTGFNEILSVELTKPAIGIPVVRIAVPGLEGPVADKAAWRPGRRARAVLGDRR